MKKLLFLSFFISVIALESYAECRNGVCRRPYQRNYRTSGPNTYYKNCNMQGRMASSECLNNTPLGLMNSEMRAEYRDFPN